METNSSACLLLVLAMERGFSNDPSNHGGATDWGITATTLADWRDRRTGNASIARFTLL